MQFFSFKVALQILGRKFYKNTKKSSLYSQSLLIFIHRTLVVKRHPITREIRDLLWPTSTPTENRVYFYMRSMFIYILKIHRRSFKQRSMKILWKISTSCYVMEFKHHSSLDIPTILFFFISGTKSKNKIRGY